MQEKIKKSQKTLILAFEVVGHSLLPLFVILKFVLSLLGFPEIELNFLAHFELSYF